MSAEHADQKQNRRPRYVETVVPYAGSYPTAYSLPALQKIEMQTCETRASIPTIGKADESHAKVWSNILERIFLNKG